MLANVQARDEADEEAGKLLDVLEEVRLHAFVSLSTTELPQACNKWGDVPMEDIQSWALQTAESISTNTTR